LPPSNRAIDHIRRERTLAAKTRLLEVPEAVEHEIEETTIPDERLELVFTCCHPALAAEAQVALTLRALGGLTTEEIAAAFVVTPETMKAPPLSRQGEDRHGRDPVRGPARRRAARPPRRGAGDRLPHLQRGLRRRALIDRALALIGRGPYVLQAAIASLQAQDPIDWPQVVALHDELAALTRSPVVELNRAVAVAQAGSPEDALQIVDRLSLDEYQYLHSTRAELLRRLGRTDEARAAYRRALELARTEPERRFLERRVEELSP
jgi:predicted RNA polymerase sigma factor